MRHTFVEQHPILLGLAVVVTYWPAFMAAGIVAGSECADARILQDLASVWQATRATLSLYAIPHWGGLGQGKESQL